MTFHNSAFDELPGLEDLIKYAEENGLWMRCTYQDIWFTPGELMAHIENGRFRWGVINWMLHDPKILLEQLKMKIELAQREFDVMEKKVATWKGNRISKKL